MKYFWSYWKTVKLKRGINIDLSLSYKCNLDCSYCVLQLTKRGVPDVEEKTMVEWEKFIDNYPKKIKQVQISGGEPSKVVWLSEFVNWLLSNHYHVVLISNLYDWTNIIKINPSHRFKIVATCHWSDNAKRFHDAHIHLVPHYQIDAREPRGKGKQRLSYTEVFELQLSVDDPVLSAFPMDVISPDFSIYHSCADHVIARGKRIS